jgi:hypothetical protein
VKVYIGYDAKEHEAAKIAAQSLLRVTHGQIEAEFLYVEKLYDQGMLWRPYDERGGQLYDLVSNEHASTEFKISRFLVPMLCQSGFALFVDCDVVFLRDPREMLPAVGTTDAVSVVKHRHEGTYNWKMVNQRQRWYPRKNWSSVMLFNCDHPANRRLTLRDVNERTARKLHAFYWLNDLEIGELKPEWNWLVDEQPRPDKLGIAHMTRGGPWIPGWKGDGAFDAEWKALQAA